MSFTRRRLPHGARNTKPVFLTWRLRGSLPSPGSFPAGATNSSRGFVAMDRLLDDRRSGPDYLRQPAIAEMLVEAFRYNADVLGHYALHAFAVMPNHVHLLLTPAVPLPKLTRALKRFTATRARAILGSAGRTFWQAEDYHRVVRDGREFHKLRLYIEHNPVRAALVLEAPEYRWSSAGSPCWPLPRAGGLLTLQ
jgi:putative transposase